MKPKRTRAEFDARVREIQRAIKENQPPPHHKPSSKYRKSSQRKLTPEEQAEAETEGKKLGWKPEHAVKYARALLRWVAAGRPTRTDEEVAEIVKTCERCKHYEAESGRCKKCGCCIKTKGLTILSKSKLSTESCVTGKW